MTHILIVDDDTELSAMLGEYLEAEGLEITGVFDGDTGLQRALSGQYDGIVLDVMLPGIDGFEVLRRIRASSSIPVLMLTAKGDDIDRIVGLEIGADDYLPKPFNPRELLARLRAILRRTQTTASKALPTTKTIQIGILELQPASRIASVSGTTLDVTSTEFNLLLVLAQHAGQVVSKEFLSKHAMGRTLEKYDRSIDMHMSNLRKKLTELTTTPSIITVRGQGYQLSIEA